MGEKRNLVPCASAFTVIVALMFISACGDDGGGGGPVTGGDVVGTWTCGPAAVRMNADETYQLSLGSGVPGLASPDVTGRYSVDGDVLEISDTGGSAACDASLTGTYRFDVDGDTCTFEIISDACAGRRQIASCTWSRN